MSMPSLDPVTTMDVAPQPVPPLQPLPAVAPMDTTPVTVNTVANTLPNNIVNAAINSATTNIVSGTVNVPVPVAPAISAPPVLTPPVVVPTVVNKPVGVPVSSTPVLNIATPTTSSVPSSNRSTVSSSVAPSSGTSALHEPTQVLSRARLQDLVREVDPTEQLDEEVEELLLQLADDFVETAVNAACLFAKHRRANTIDVKDVQLHLERNWNMWLPGVGTDELRPYKRSSVTEAHKQRLALIRKALKKY